MLLISISIVVSFSMNFITAQNCQKPSITETVGTLLGTRNNFCSQQLIFNDDFSTFRKDVWKYEVTASGNGINEFQVYVDDPENLFVKNGILHIRPTLTASKEDLTSGKLNLYPQCTEAYNNGCERTGRPDEILPPIRSAKIKTENSFAFKYGRLEVRAKIPLGDWLWPAIWLLPQHPVYGPRTASGEIDVMEARGNKQFITKAGGNIGSEQVSSTLHYGPLSEYVSDSNYTDLAGGFDKAFHKYILEWSPEKIQFFVDKTLIESVDVQNLKSQFPNTNIYKNGASDAPFDKPFYIILNLAVGSTMFFADDDEVDNILGAKPWKNSDGEYAATKFWQGKNQWLPTWDINSPDSHSQFLIDYVKVWAL